MPSCREKMVRSALGIPPPNETTGVVAELKVAINLANPFKSYIMTTRGKPYGECRPLGEHKGFARWQPERSENYATTPQQPKTI